MKCPKCRTETPIEALRCPECKLKTPRGRVAEVPGEDPESRWSQFCVEGRSQELKPWVSWLLILSSVSLCAIGSYISFTYFSGPPESKPPLHQSVLDKLRLMPSNQSWMTVEEVLISEVEKSEKQGRLVEAEGWDVRQMEDGTFLVTYSFQERDNQQQLAVWNVNPWTNSYICKSDLAEFILKSSAATQ